MLRINNIVHKCHFCGGLHNCRSCPQEAKIAPFLKKEIGTFMERFISNSIPCQKCKKYALDVLGNHTPSLDLICSNCNEPYEVKSKCLSAKKIPIDLMMSHGNYFDYLNRQNNGLNFFVLIYSVDRKNKTVMIRKVLYISDEIIKSSDKFSVEKKNDSSLSTIFIRNYQLLESIRLHQNYKYSFKDAVEKIKIDL